MFDSIRNGSVLASLLAAAALIGGCNLASLDGWSKRHEELRTLTVEAPTDAGLRVRTANGGVRVERVEAGPVTIEAKLRARSAERLAETKVVAERDNDGALNIHVRWPNDRRRDDEGCSLTVQAPDAAFVRAATGNGPIVLTGFSGPATARTSNGQVTIRDHDGPVNVDTSNGAVTLTEIGGEATARTSNGAIATALKPNNPGPVSLETSNGRIRLKVGEAFTGRLTLRTSNGGITLAPPRYADVVEVEDDRAVLLFASATETTSRVKTSNGSIHLETVED